MRRLAAIFASVLLPALVFAEDPPQAEPVVRISLSPETVAVGEAAELRLTVLGPTWFPRPPEFPSFEVPNALVRLPPDSSRATSESVNGERWNGVTRRYQVYPLMGARFRLGGEPVRVTVADPGKPSIDYEVPVPTVALRASVPAGAESLDPFIAGSNFSVDRELDGNMAALEVGSAVVVTYTAELDGLHAMFIPPLAPELATEGVSVYAETPVVDDAAPGRRSEKLTLVFEAGGEYSIPPSEFRWWNTATGGIDSASIEGLTLTVAGPPLPADGSVAPPSRSGLRLVVIAGLSVLSVGLAVLVLPRLVRWSQAKQAARHASEAYAFGRIKRAIRQEDPGEIERALLEWLPRLEPGMDSRTLARRHGDPELALELDNLNRLLYGKVSDNSVDLRGLGTLLSTARRRCLECDQPGLQSALPPLNP